MTNNHSACNGVQKRLIEEISSEQAASYTESHGGGGKVCIPAHSVVVREPDSKHPRRRVLVKVMLPGVTSVDKVDLEVSKVSQATCTICRKCHEECQNDDIAGNSCSVDHRMTCSCQLSSNTVYRCSYLPW